MNGKTVIIIGVLSGLMLSCVSCSNIPFTGRRQLNLIPSSVMLSMSFQNYSDFLAQNKLSDDAVKKQMVERVGRRIQAAVERYCRDTEQSHLLDGYDWEFSLIESPEQNAWVMPGGKVVVYSGILAIAQDDAGLATVMGHELAHALAKHGAERLTQVLLIEFGAVAMDKVMEEKPERTRDMFFQAYGIGTGIGVALPHSRMQEREADHIGLMFMALAGYDPHAAIGFWERMSQAGDGGSVPEILSTHPSGENRIKDIKRLIPEVMQYYTPESVRWQGSEKHRTAA